MNVEKKNILYKGIGLHILAYLFIGFILTMLNVPFVISGVIVLVLLWGLFVISYAYYYEK